VATKGLAIHLLGEFRVSVGPRTIAEREWTVRKAKSLVKLLALAPRHRLHREHVIDRL
jgi:DNA-binding SARP family transcriptional activator